MGLLCSNLFYFVFFLAALIDAHAHAWFESQLRFTYLYNMYHISITLLLLKSMGSEKKINVKMKLHQQKIIFGNKSLASERVWQWALIAHTHCVCV